jgi:hypothetical protein
MVQTPGRANNKVFMASDRGRGRRFGPRYYTKEATAIDLWPQYLHNASRISSNKSR